MLSINLDGLENNVKPAMSNTMKYLKNAQDILYAIKVPSDFSYYSKLRNIPNTISDIYNNVNTQEKWLEDCINNFDNAENSNKGLLDNIASLIGNFSFSIGENSSNTSDSNGSNTVLDDIANTFAEAKEIISNVIEGDFLGDLINDAGELASETASNISDNITSFFESAFSTGAQIVEGIENFFQNDVPNAIIAAGTVLSDTWQSFSENVLEPIGNFALSAVASLGNVVISVVKGLASLVEGLFDTIVILVSGVGTVLTGLWDLGGYLASLAIGNTENWESVTASMWSNTMSFVADNHVENAFSDFYKNNVIGQWLDEHAHDWFKSDGPVTSVISGIGYIGGIVGLTLLTAGIGGVALGGASAASGGSALSSLLSTTGISAVIAGFAGFGGSAEDAWGSMRDSSMEGIEEAFKNGEISEEQYNSIIMIKGLTDEQWSEIVADFERGKFTLEQYQAMLQIRQIPDDWKNFDNWLRGIGYGTATGVWEGIQWYLGGKLAGWSVSGNQAISSATRIGIDSIFNAGDTPFRALIESIAYGESFEEAFKNQGGTDAMLINFGIGFLGSLGGEIFDAHTINKLTDRLNNSSILNNLDEATATKIKEFIESQDTNNKIIIDKMTDVELDNYIIDLITKRNSQIDEATKFLYGNQSGIISEQVKLKIENGIDAINKTGLLDSLDESTATRIRNEIMSKYFSDKINLDSVSNYEIENYIKAYIERRNNQIEFIKKGMFGGEANPDLSDFVSTKIEDGVSIINKSGFLDNLDEESASRVSLRLIEDYFQGKIDLKKMTEEELEQYAKNTIQYFDEIFKLNAAIIDSQALENSINILQHLDDKFKESLEVNGTYGVNQGVFRKLETSNPEYYKELVEDFSKKYGMSNETAVTIMGHLDSIGACSYADSCNVIISKFIDNPQKFEEIFGFPLYTSDGKFNSERLLFDMYLWANSKNNGGALFDVDSNGNIEFIGEFNDKGQFATQEYMNTNQRLDQYLKSKSDELECLTNEINIYYLNENGIKNSIIDAINEGKQVSISTKGEAIYTNVDTGEKVVIDGGHITKIIGIVDDKIIVASWGEKYYLNLSDLLEKNGNVLYIRDIIFQ